MIVAGFDPDGPAVPGRTFSTEDGTVWVAGRKAVVTALAANCQRRFVGPLEEAPDAVQAEVAVPDASDAAALKKLDRAKLAHVALRELARPDGYRARVLDAIRAELIK